MFVFSQYHRSNTAYLLNSWSLANPILIKLKQLEDIFKNKLFLPKTAQKGLNCTKEFVTNKEYNVTLNITKLYKSGLTK